jgi:metallophosphoesterase (TIGR03767 family)
VTAATGPDDVKALGPTIVPVRDGLEGYRRLVAGPNEAHVVRTDLGGSPPGARLRALLCFVQVSDLHITDAQSPGRAEYLNRLGDDDSPVASFVGPIGTYRTQESLTCQVAEAMNVAIRCLDGGPVTGAPIAFAVATGDSADNAQANEIEASIGLITGGVDITPDSGDLTQWEGVGGPDAYDPRYWHPDGTPAGGVEDRPRARFGFPIVPHLLDAARRRFPATGVGVPWHPVYGNHDCLMAGTVVPAPSLRRFTRGRRKPSGWPPGVSPDDMVAFFGDTERTNPNLKRPFQGVPWRRVGADPGRDQLDRREWRDAHDHRSARPVGAPTYYGFDAGAVRGLVLDTVNINGGWQGSIDAGQLAWLESQLEAGSSRWVDDRLFVLFSHHPLRNLINAWAPGGEHLALADEVEAVLERFGNLVAWVDGHTHTHTITPHRSHPALGGGWWEITTASHVDWPQQARLIELAEDLDTGTVIVGTTVIDHTGLVDPRLGSLDEVATLAGWSRELAANDWQRSGRAIEPVGRGRPEDRNVVLVSPVLVPRAENSTGPVGTVAPVSTGPSRR